ncbi:MAG: PAS domain S-box protein [Methylococcales bacterium]
MTNHIDKFGELRARAEKLLSPSEMPIATDSVAQSISQIRQTIHELYTYRIELELQNDELLDAQSQLQEISQEYRDFYDLAPVAYVSLNPLSRILKANNALVNFLGFPKQYLLKQVFTDYVLDSDQDALYLYRQALIDKQKPVACEFRLRHKNGQLFWVNCEGFLKEAAFGHEINLILTDITERKKAEQALQDFLSHQDRVLEGHKAKIEHEIQEEVSGNLIGLKIELNGLRKQLPGELANCHEKCAVMNAQVDTLLQASIGIAAELRPVMLDQLGLFAAIEEKIKDFGQQSGLDCDLNIPEKTPVIDKHRGIAVFRILEEALKNIDLHASASRVSVEVDLDSDNLILKISDNGCGMANTGLPPPRKFGILGMRERARNLGGNLSLVSTVGQGTSLVLTVPVKIL